MFYPESKIIVPDISQVIAIEKELYGERKELFQESADVLHEVSHAKSDPAVRWKLANLKNLIRGFDRVQRESKFKDTRPAGMLRIKANVKGEVFDLGLVSVNMVTTAGVNFVIDAIQGLATITNFKYHASGTTNTAEAIGDTALVVEVDTRVAGTQIEGASTNIYKTVATLVYTATRTIVEHGLFDQLALGGTLFDRSIFTGIGVNTATSIEFDYQWTLNAGG